MANTQLYLMGKYFDPEIRETSTHKTYLRFSVYYNHTMTSFDVFEKQKSFVDGEDEKDNPLFKELLNYHDGVPIMAVVTPSYNERYKTIVYRLEKVYVVDEPAQKAIRDVLSRKSITNADD